MQLTSEQTKTLQDIVSFNFNFLVNYRRTLQNLPVPKENVQTLDDEVCANMKICLQFNELSNTFPIDGEFLWNMPPSHFDLIVTFVRKRIQSLEAELKSVKNIDPEFSLTVEPLYESRIDFLNRLSDDMNFIANSLLEQ